MSSDVALDRGGGDAGIIPQPGAEADLGVKELAGCQRFIFLDKVDDMERHLIVAAPGNIGELIIKNDRHDVSIFTEHRR